jgi:hypothetical protein
MKRIAMLTVLGYVAFALGLAPVGKAAAVTNCTIHFNNGSIWPPDPQTGDYCNGATHQQLICSPYHVYIEAYGTVAHVGNRISVGTLVGQHVALGASKTMVRTGNGSYGSAKATAPPEGLSKGEVRHWCYIGGLVAGMTGHASCDLLCE